MDKRRRIVIKSLEGKSRRRPEDYENICRCGALLKYTGSYQNVSESDVSLLLSGYQTVSNGRKVFPRRIQRRGQNVPTLRYSFAVGIRFQMCLKNVSTRWIERAGSGRGNCLKWREDGGGGRSQLIKWRRCRWSDGEVTPAGGKKAPKTMSFTKIGVETLVVRV